MVLKEYGAVANLVRGLFADIDRTIYSVFGSLIKVYFGMAEMDLLNADAIKALKTRIYVFISIYMVFKISISLLQAMVNPEVANDKKTGLGTIISRIGVSIILLVAVPLAMDNILFGSTNGRTNQEIIASLVPKVILGSSTTAVASDTDVQDNIGQHIASAAWNAFLPLNPECGDGEENKLVNMKVTSIANHVGDQCTNNNKKYFKYDYSYVVSTICGAIMCIMLIGYSLDIVARILKLQILEVLAPIPILAYVDPGKGKDNLFNIWGKTLISTYLDFFIKLAILYFVIFAMSSFITNIDDIMPSSFSGLEKGYCTVVIIIGLLLALQQLPQFICSLFNIKYQGMGAGLGTLLGAGAGFLSGGVAGALAGGAAGLSGKGVMDSINKGKGAGAKTTKGQQKAADKQAKTNERLARKYGLKEAEAFRKQEKEDAEKEEQDAKFAMDQKQAEYDAKVAAGTATQDDAKELAGAIQNYDTVHAKADKARSDYEKAKSNAADPMKAHAKGYGGTRLEVAKRYVATSISNINRRTADRWTQNRGSNGATMQQYDAREGHTDNYYDRQDAQRERTPAEFEPKYKNDDNQAVGDNYRNRNNGGNP